ncbi:ABC transporter ATP-binding protein [Temperatibacter marinus]|uniref:ABC transporter ATP-binding protein n=1 Tax=Temperatibacter marinus TaxID=1456591 RepID=A0AA52EGC6_9PROT|nr:ABC transporter ATP-binding protein [Temperatibacter marinus]WND01814.1 ABC transporter ATP-binding protein [Temperatibacter marinus]
MTNTLLSLETLSLNYGDLKAVKDVSFSLMPGEIGCFLGPSGCGKTSLLRLISGFEKPSAGEILLKGLPLANEQTFVKAEDRKIGMVFQDFALFPHMTVSENIAFGLAGVKRKVVEEKVQALLDLVDLVAEKNRYPHQISGGQQQRVALARAMAPNPTLLLLDEPFSSLDSTLRSDLAQNIRSVLKKNKMSAILVTHDQQEAFAMADKIGVFDQGRLCQWDTATALYHQPMSQEVASFIGEGHWIAGKVLTENTAQTSLGVIKISSRFKKDESIAVHIRPEDIILGVKECEAQILSAHFQGDRYKLEILYNDLRLFTYVPTSKDSFQEGQSIYFALNKREYSAFATDSQ